MITRSRWATIGFRRGQLPFDEFSLQATIIRDMLTRPGPTIAAAVAAAVSTPAAAAAPAAADAAAAASALARPVPPRP